MRAHGFDDRFGTVIACEDIRSAHAHASECMKVRRADRCKRSARGKVLEILPAPGVSKNDRMADFGAIEFLDGCRVEGRPETRERMRRDRGAALTMDLVRLICD